MLRISKILTSLSVITGIALIGCGTKTVTGPDQNTYSITASSEKPVNSSEINEKAISLPYEDFSISYKGAPADNIVKTTNSQIIVKASQPTNETKQESYTNETKQDTTIPTEQKYAEQKGESKEIKTEQLNEKDRNADNFKIIYTPKPTVPYSKVEPTTPKSKDNATKISPTSVTNKQYTNPALNDDLYQYTDSIDVWAEPKPID
jgi:hypothetical protein